MKLRVCKRNKQGWGLRVYILDKLGTKRNKDWFLPFWSLQTAVINQNVRARERGVRVGKSNRSSRDRDDLVKDIRKASLEKMTLQVGNQE